MGMYSRDNKPVLCHISFLSTIVYGKAKSSRNRKKTDTKLCRTLLLRPKQRTSGRKSTKDAAPLAAVSESHGQLTLKINLHRQLTLRIENPSLSGTCKRAACWS